MPKKPIPFVVLATIILLTFSGQAAKGQGMVAWYEFENDLDDSSGNGYSGTIAGGAPTYVAGRTGYGQAIHLNSINDSIEWGLPTNLAVSVSLWVKLDPNAPVANPWFLDQMTSAWSGWQIKPEKLSSSTAQVRWILADYTSTRRTTLGAANTLYDGSWHHIAATHDGVQTATLYYDGLQVGQTTNWAFKPAPAGTTMKLNNLLQGGVSQGDVDDITVWNRALTASEVASLFYDNTVMYLRVTPGNQSATALEGYSSPSPTLQSYVVSNSDSNSSHTVNITKVDANGNPASYGWLTLSTSQLVIASGGSGSVTPTINHLSPVVLAPGVYTAYLKFADDSSPPQTLIRQIQLTVLGCQWAVSPETFQRYYTFGSGAQVFPATFTVTNTGKHGLTYEVQEVVDQSWLSLSKASGGPLNYLATDTVTATINATGLAAGTYSCVIRFANDCLPLEVHDCTVALVVETNSSIPFVISYYDNVYRSLPVSPVGYSNLAAGGFNVVNGRAGNFRPDEQEVEPNISPSLAAEYGLWAMPNWDTNGSPVIPYDPTFINQRAQDLAFQYGSYTNVLGYRLRDEPPADEWPAIGLMAQKLREYDPDCVPWVNILPNYSYERYGTGITSHKQYLDSYMSIVVPKVLCYDDYVAANNTTYPPNNYDLYWQYSNMKRFRQYGVTYGLPYWYILESNLFNKSPNTEGIYRFQIFSALAYGFRGVLYFTYTTQTEGSDYALAYYRNQSGTWGTPMSKYAVAQSVNREVIKLAPTLMKLTSWSVCHAGTVPTLPAGASSIPLEDRETFSGLDGFYVDAITGGNCVLGNLVDAIGRTYLMFVNENYVSNRTFTVTLDSANVTGLGRVDKTTGKLVLAYMKTPGNNTMSLPLTAGNGELFKVLLDTNAPSVPTNLQGTPRSATAIKLTWNASSDPQSGIDHYTIYRDNVEVATSTSLSFTNFGLLPASSYSFKVAAVNGEGLESGQSPSIPVSTLTVPSPSILRIDVTNGLVNVTWDSVIGADYQLLKTTNLVGSDWTNGGGAVNATATETSATEAQSADPTFYRVRALP
jgi:hypothetical protein